MLPPPATLFTVGHSNRALEELIALIEPAGIRTLVDIRAQPMSSRHPHFSEALLRPAVETRGITYHWAGRQLGGLRKPRDDSAHRALTDDGLRGFADHMETETFQRGVAQLLRLSAAAPTAFLCAEKLPENCHRALIADYLVLKNVVVRHLIEPGHTREHALDARARRESTQLIYDRFCDQPLGLV